MMKQTLSIFTLLAAGVSHAAGFAFDTHTARGTAMGFATTATVNDASAVAYNPANILAVEKLDILAGDITTLPDIQFTPEGGEAQSMDPLVVPPPHLFAAYRINDKMAAGLGVFLPFAAGADWKDDFVARTRGYEAQLATFFINPTFAYQVHDRLRLGAGFSVVRGTVVIRRKIDFVDSEGTIELGGSSWAFGYNAGLDFVVVDKLLNFGAHFRGPTKMTFTGTSDFQDIPAEFQSLLVDQGVESTITMPGTLNLGFAFTPIERLTLALDAQLAMWSSFEEFLIEFDNEALNDPLPKHWKNTWNFRFGAEYGVTDSLFARVGAAYDPAPTPEDTLTPELPDANRYYFSAGIGYDFKPVRVDLCYQFAYLTETQSTAPGFVGTYSGTANVVGITVGYSMK